MAKKVVPNETQRIISCIRIYVLKELDNTNVRAEVRLKTWEVLEKAFKKSINKLKINFNETTNDK